MLVSSFINRISCCEIGPFSQPLSCVCVCVCPNSVIGPNCPSQDCVHPLDWLGRRTCTVLPDSPPWTLTGQTTCLERRKKRLKRVISLAPGLCCCCPRGAPLHVFPPCVLSVCSLSLPSVCSLRLLLRERTWLLFLYSLIPAQCPLGPAYNSFSVHVWLINEEPASLVFIGVLMKATDRICCHFQAIPLPGVLLKPVQDLPCLLLVLSV